MKKRVSLYGKKSQGSLEFAFSYWWGFVAVAITIGIVAYVGFIRPDNTIVPERCWFGEQLICTDQFVQKYNPTQGQIFFKLKNNFGTSIRVTNITAIDNNYIFSSCNQPINIGSKEIKEVICIIDLPIVKGDSYEIPVLLTFRNNESPSKPKHKLAGEINTVIPVDSFITRPECNDGIDNDGNGCADFISGDTGCVSPSDPTESGGVCTFQNSTLTCSIVSSCSGTSVFKMSYLDSAHAELPGQSNFNYHVCCTSSFDTLSNTCPGDVTVLKLSNVTDAHVEKNTESNFTNSVCLSASNQTVVCNYSIGGCAQIETCLASISGDTDAHVADCTTDPLKEFICCRLI